MTEEKALEKYDCGFFDEDWIMTKFV